MSIFLTQNYFELFDLPVQFKIDLGKLKQAYHAIQARTHPDRFTQSSEAERRVSMQWTTHANQAYRTLKDPLQRAIYLLQLQGIDALAENNTAMPTEFLLAQIEWRESIQNAKSAQNSQELMQINQRLQQTILDLQHKLAITLDHEHDHPAATLVVLQLKFYEKLDEEIGNVSETIAY